MSNATVGFIGVGRLGFPLAGHLIDAGHTVVGTSRGRAAEFIERGGAVAGDGTPRAVAEAAGVVITCVPSERELDAVVNGPDGLLSAPGTAPLVIDLSTAATDEVRRIREALVARGGELLDCPVSGTPEMAQVKKAVIYASGEQATYEKAEPLLKAMLPASVYVGELGAGTQFKYIANLLAFVHVTAAAEAMAFASAAGLDLARVAEVISASPGATSGQFSIRAPMMAAGNFESTLVTVDMMREVLGQVSRAAEECGARTPLVAVVKELYDELADQGEGQSDPAKLLLHLKGAASNGATTA